MAQMIVAFLGTAAWVGGVLVLVVMAALPLLEHVADAGRRRRAAARSLIGPGGSAWFPADLRPGPAAWPAAGRCSRW
jgi:hypothetical protein